MASPNAPKTSEELIREFSQARVVMPSRKKFITGYTFEGDAKFSRQLTDADAVDAMARKYGR